MNIDADSQAPKGDCERRALAADGESCTRPTFEDFRSITSSGILSNLGEAHLVHELANAWERQGIERESESGILAAFSDAALTCYKADEQERLHQLREVASAIQGIAPQANIVRKILRKLACTAMEERSSAAAACFACFCADLGKDATPLMRVFIYDVLYALGPAAPSIVLGVLEGALGTSKTLALLCTTNASEDQQGILEKSVSVCVTAKLRMVDPLGYPALSQIWVVSNSSPSREDFESAGVERCTKLFDRFLHTLDPSERFELRFAFALESRQLPPALLYDRILAQLVWVRLRETASHLALRDDDGSHGCDDRLVRCLEIVDVLCDALRRGGCPQTKNALAHLLSRMRKLCACSILPNNARDIAQASLERIAQ